VGVVVSDRGFPVPEEFWGTALRSLKSFRHSSLFPLFPPTAPSFLKCCLALLTFLLSLSGAETTLTLPFFFKMPGLCPFQPMNVRIRKELARFFLSEADREHVSCSPQIQFRVVCEGVPVLEVEFT